MTCWLRFQPHYSENWKMYHLRFNRILYLILKLFENYDAILWFYLMPSIQHKSCTDSICTNPHNITLANDLFLVVLRVQNTNKSDCVCKGIRCSTDSFPYIQVLIQQMVPKSGRFHISGTSSVSPLLEKFLVLTECNE